MGVYVVAAGPDAAQVVILHGDTQRPTADPAWRAARAFAGDIERTKFREPSVGIAPERRLVAAVEGHAGQQEGVVVAIAVAARGLTAPRDLREEEPVPRVGKLLEQPPARRDAGEAREPAACRLIAEFSLGLGVLLVRQRPGIQVSQSHRATVRKRHGSQAMVTVVALREPFAAGSDVRQLAVDGVMLEPVHGSARHCKLRQVAAWVVGESTKPTTRQSDLDNASGVVIPEAVGSAVCMGERTRPAVSVVAHADPAWTPLHHRRPAVAIVTVDQRRESVRLNAHNEPVFVERQNPSPSGRCPDDLPPRGLESRRVLAAIDAPRVRLAGEAEWVPCVSEGDLP